MVQAADFSFATADAIPEVKQAADFQLKSASTDAVVRSIFHIYEPMPWSPSLEEEKRKERKKRHDG